MSGTPAGVAYAKFLPSLSCWALVGDRFDFIVVMAPCGFRCCRFEEPSQSSQLHQCSKDGIADWGISLGWCCFVVESQEDRGSRVEFPESWSLVCSDDPAVSYSPRLY